MVPSMVGKRDACSVALTVDGMVASSAEATAEMKAAPKGKHLADKLAESSACD